MKHKSSKFLALVFIVFDTYKGQYRPSQVKIEKKKPTLPHHIFIKLLRSDNHTCQ